MTRNPKRPRDTNQLAKAIVDIAARDEGSDGPAQVVPPTTPAIEFARAGGLKGGRARADKLSAEQRADIARKAAAARWRRNDD